MEVIEISKAIRGYEIVLRAPKDSEFKSEGLFTSRVNPMIIEFPLTVVPPVYSKVKIKMEIIE